MMLCLPFLVLLSKPNPTSKKGRPLRFAMRINQLGQPEVPILFLSRRVFDLFTIANWAASFCHEVYQW